MVIARALLACKARTALLRVVVAVRSRHFHSPRVEKRLFPLSRLRSVQLFKLAFKEQFSPLFQRGDVPPCSPMLRGGIVGRQERVAFLVFCLYVVSLFAVVVFGVQLTPCIIVADKVWRGRTDVGTCPTHAQPEVNRLHAFRLGTFARFRLLRSQTCPISIVDGFLPLECRLLCFRLLQQVFIIAFIGGFVGSLFFCSGVHGVACQHRSVT